ILQPGEEAVVKVTILPGRDSFQGSTKHGVTSKSYGEWSGSYGIEATTIPPRPELHRDPRPPTTSQEPPPEGSVAKRDSVGQSYSCPAVGDVKGNVWSTDIYTDDSDVATAAVHAGVLKNGESGRVKVTILPGQQRYEGSTRNGVTSGSWDGWDGSFKVEK